MNRPRQQISKRPRLIQRPLKFGYPIIDVAAEIIAMRLDKTGDSRPHSVKWHRRQLDRNIPRGTFRRITVLAPQHVSLLALIFKYRRSTTKNYLCVANEELIDLVEVVYEGVARHSFLHLVEAVEDEQKLSGAIQHLECFVGSVSYPMPVRQLVGDQACDALVSTKMPQLNEEGDAMTFTAPIVPSEPIGASSRERGLTRSVRA